MYFSSSKNLGVDSQTIISKLTQNGILDTTFGNNGNVVLNLRSFKQNLTRQTDGKLLVFCYDYATYQANIVRILPSGQLDTSFGSNGVVVIPNIKAREAPAGYGLLLQNDKIIVYGENANNFTSTIDATICRLNPNGTIDINFGNNGFLNVFSTHVLLDNYFNIICISDGASQFPPYFCILSKFDTNGQVMTSFGNNGSLDLNFNLNSSIYAFIDDNNKIVYSNGNDQIHRINPNGTIDNTFNYNFTQNFGGFYCKIIQKNGSYFAGGNNDIIGTSNYLITKFNNNGNLDGVFNYYLENSQNLTQIIDMVVDDDYIIVIGSGNIVKYLLNTTSLSTNDTNQDNEIFFENPAKQNLNFQNFDKILSAEILSVEGKLVKQITENNSNISELPKGIYFVRTNLKNGKFHLKKLIKI